ncbi:MAG: hypothetical protein WDO06_03960 [Actinomycetota bacterium]
MSVLVFAGGLQIFVEPQLLNGGIYTGIADSWSFDQLSYNLAFMSGDFGAASALSILLLFKPHRCTYRNLQDRYV